MPAAMGGPTEEDYRHADATVAACAALAGYSLLTRGCDAACRLRHIYVPLDSDIGCCRTGQPKA